MLSISSRMMEIFENKARLDLMARLSQSLVDHRLADGNARQIAEMAVRTAIERNVFVSADIEAFAEILCRFGSNPEPAWCAEIMQGSSPDKAARLRACASVVS